MPPTHQTIMVLTTWPAKGDPSDIAKRLITQGRLAACIQVFPVQSFFKWEGKTQSEGEHLVLIKTSEERYEGLIAWLRAEHPYDLPEIITINPTWVDPHYNAWLQDVLNDKKG